MQECVASAEYIDVEEGFLLTEEKVRCIYKLLLEDEKQIKKEGPHELDELWKDPKQRAASTHSRSVLLVFSLLSVIFAGLCVISSVLLLVGLCVDNRLMLLPWIVSVSIRTILDLVVSLYFFFETKLDTVLAALFVVDISICALNIYSILCVISQYQEYIAGRGTAGQCRSSQQPAVFYCSTPLCESRPKVTIKVTENSSQSASLKGHHIVIQSEPEESGTRLWVKRTKKISAPDIPCGIHRSHTDVPEYHEKELSSDYADNDSGVTSLSTEAEPLIPTRNCRRAALFRNTSDIGRTTKSAEQLTKAMKTSVSFASTGCLQNYETSLPAAKNFKSTTYTTD